MKIRGEAGEQLLEVRIICTKISKGSGHEHSMGVIPKYVVVTWIQIRSFDEMNWKIVGKVLPNSPASEPLRSSASLLWGTPIEIKPRKIRNVEKPVVAYD